MASSIAHEINNPLQATVDCVFLVRMAPDVPESAKSQLDIAAEELERIAHLTKQTLAFNRHNTTPKAMQIGTSLDGVLRLYGPRLKAREITVEKRYAQVAPIVAIESVVPSLTGSAALIGVRSIPV